MAQPTQDQMQARAIDLHGRNVAAGWWTDPNTGESLKGKRPALELIALVHSEISEGLEGDRKCLMDDKLMHRPMVEVELADAEIRLYDFAGGFDLDLTADVEDTWSDIIKEAQGLERVSEYLGFAHIVVSGISAAGLPSVDDEEMRTEYVVCAIRFIHVIADKFGFDVDGAREEKLAYNAQRADHKPENRRLEGGKAY